jgi:drug/metabolite transporter (DMT)-like permease
VPTTTSPVPTRRLLVWTGLLVLYFVWGSTYLGIAVAVQTIPPFFMAAARFALAGAILLGWSIAREGPSFNRPSRREWRDSFIVGALLLGTGMGFVSLGEKTVPSGITALLIGMMPVWIAIFGRVFLGERLPRMAVLGIAIGFGGVAILVGPSAFGGSGALDPIGLAAIIISPISWATGSLFASHRAMLPSRPLVATGLQMISGAAVLVILGSLHGEVPKLHLEAISSDSIVAFVYLTAIGSILAFTTYGWLLRVAPLPFIATYAYVNPVVAVLLGALVLHESIEPRTLVAGSVIVTAVALIVTTRGRLRTPAPRQAPAPRLSGARIPSDSLNQG